MRWVDDIMIVVRRHFTTHRNDRHCAHVFAWEAHRYAVSLSDIYRSHFDMKVEDSGKFVGLCTDFHGPHLKLYPDITHAKPRYQHALSGRTVADKISVVHSQMCACLDKSTGEVEAKTVMTNMFVHFLLCKYKVAWLQRVARRMSMRHPYLRDLVSTALTDALSNYNGGTFETIAVV